MERPNKKDYLTTNQIEYNQMLNKYYDDLEAYIDILEEQLNLTDVVKRYRVEAISTINKKELYNEIFESKQKAEELCQVLLIKYYKTYTSVKMTELSIMFYNLCVQGK